MRTALSRMVAFRTRLSKSSAPPATESRPWKKSSPRSRCRHSRYGDARSDGLETLRRIMDRFPAQSSWSARPRRKMPRPLSSRLSAGAFDYVPKHLSPLFARHRSHRSDLVAKIRAAHSREIPFCHSPFQKPPRPARTVSAGSLRLPAIVAIGSSTGGPKALEEILPLSLAIFLSRFSSCSTCPRASPRPSRNA